MTTSDLDIIKEALLNEQHFIETHESDRIPNLRRVVERIKRLERRRDTAYEAAQRDTDVDLDPDTWGH